MSTRNETTPRRGMTFGDFLTAMTLLAMITAFGVIVAMQFGWVPPLVLGPGMDAPQARPTVQVVPPVQQPAQVAPAPVVAPVVPTAYIPVEREVQYQAAPPASVPVEELQPRVEVVEVQRAPEQTTIIRTVPQNPSGPPIVIDGGQKRRGAPRP